MGDMAARITPLGILAITVLDDPTTETLAAFQDAVKAPLETQIRERDERIRKLEEAARAAYAHVIELQDAWIRGVLSEHDGLGGTRSNRNDDVLHLITHALGEG